MPLIWQIVVFEYRGWQQSVQRQNGGMSSQEIEQLFGLTMGNHCIIFINNLSIWLVAIERQDLPQTQCVMLAETTYHRSFCNQLGSHQGLFRDVLSSCGD